MKRKYWNCLAMGALSLAMLLAGCGGGDTTSSAQPSAPTESADVTQAQTESETITLKVGTHGSFSPYAFVDENSDDPQGFEVDVMNEIAKRANLEVDIQVAEWNGVFGMLDAGQLDTIACVVSPTDERREKYDFSEPYLRMDTGIGVQEGQADSIQKLEDLAGKKIGVNAGGQAMEFLESLQDQVQFEIVAYESPASMEYDLALGRLDGIYESIVAILQAQGRGDCPIEPAAMEPLTTSVCAYPFVKDSERNAEAITRINAAIKEMQEDGTMMELSMKWFNLDQVTI